MYDNESEIKKIAKQAWHEAYKKRCRHELEQDGKAPWDRVTGPASAVMATMDEIGWKMLSPTKANTDTGETVDFAKQRPHLISVKVAQAVERKVWHQARMSDEDKCLQWDYQGNTPWWYPIREMANHKDAATARAA